MDSGYIIYVVDTETTGLSAIDNDVIEISFCRLSMSSPDDREQKTWYLKALSPSTIQDEALKINGHKKADILHFTKAGKDKYLEPSDVVADIENWVMEDDMSAIDRILIGQNIDFDIRAMKALWDKAGCKETFPFEVDKGMRTLDTKQVATMIDLLTGRRRRYYNLSTLVKSFGVKKRKAHRAEDDVAMTVDVLIKMLTPLGPVVSEAFSGCYTDLDQ